MSDIKSDNKRDNKGDSKNTGQTSGLDVLMPGHEYDGIQEFNNPAPFWWQLFFYLSIAFGVGYFAYYQLMGGPTLKEELTVKLEKIEALQVKSHPKGADESVLMAVMADPAKMAVGQKVFGEKCAACHAPDGGGLVGPNLTDNYWIHGQGKLLTIYEVVEDGVLDKGMPAWRNILAEDEILDVVGYVKSLKGKPVATAKPPQGDLVSE